MIRNILTVVLLTASIVIAKDTVPTTVPTTRPSIIPPGKAIKPLVKPAKAATTKSTVNVADDHFPTPSEILEKIKSGQAKTDKLPKVAHFDLSDPVVERAPEFSILGTDRLLTLHGLIERLHRARDDKNLRGVLITLGETSFNLSQAQEIRSALAELTKSGKRSFIYADGYDTPSYVAASGATDICLLSGGEIMIPGVSIETMYAKGVFDKFGVKADYVQIGEYKGADEMYTRTEASPESKGELNKIVESLYGVLVDTIATNRNISKTAVKGIIDDCILTAKQAKERKLVDHLLNQDELRELMAKELGDDEVNLLSDYGAPAKQKLDFSNPFTLLAQIAAKKPKESDKPAIALIHADGVIVDGEAEDGLMGASGNVGSENIRKAFRMALRDDNVKAIVLRIDSPGGSALASEVMWQAVNNAAQDKPVIVSVGTMAASGGYYLASAGDYIFADPSAIVGSIGVVGGKFVLHDLFEKIGLGTETFARGKNAGLFSQNNEWTDRQRTMVTNWMKATYEQFTERVMTNRKGKIKDIDSVARGRIFLAKQAKELGMVDEIGGLTDAITFAAKEAELKEYDVKLVPESRSLLDMIAGGGGDEGPDAKMPFKTKITLSADSPLKMLPSSTRQLIMQQVQFMQLLEKRPVVLVSPYVIKVK